MVNVLCPAIADTRITVEFILESLAAGETPEQLLEGYPRLKQEEIQAALAFAIATCAIQEDCTLVTRNIEDFRKINWINGLEPLSL